MRIPSIKVLVGLKHKRQAAVKGSPETQHVKKAETDGVLQLKNASLNRYAGRLAETAGIGFEEAEKMLREAHSTRRIPYKAFVRYSLYKIPPEKQYETFLQKEADRQARTARMNFIKAPSVLCNDSESAISGEHTSLNEDLRYVGYTREHQPAPIVAACYYLGIPLPENANGSYQPSAFVSPISGALEDIRWRVGEKYIPDTPEMRKEYAGFVKKYKNSSVLNYNETDLAIFFVDHCFHCMDYGYRNSDYFDFDFFASEPDVRNTFMSTKGYKRFTRRVCIKDINLFKDKGNFNRKFASIINRDWVDTTTCSFEEFKQFVSRQPVFFAKPVRGTGGNGACLINSSEFANLEELFRYCQENEYMTEERVAQHEKMAAFNKDTLNTIRVYALVDIDDVPHITGAVSRYGRVGSIVDNFHQGGMEAAVDVETGELTSDAFDIYGARYSHHPDSGLKFKGFQIPEWEKLKQTVYQACDICKDINRHIGWDVSITASGGVEIIEGNATPNFDFQAAGKIGQLHVYQKYLTPLAKAAGIKPYNQKVPAMKITEKFYRR